MANYSIRFLSRDNRLIYEHLGAFANDRDAESAARQDALGMKEFSDLRCEVWSGEVKISDQTNWRLPEGA